MAEAGVPITPGTGGASIASDLVGGNNYQQVKIVDATLGSSNAWKVNGDGSAQVSVVGTVIITGSVQASFNAVANQSVSGTVGASIIGAVPINIQSSVAAVIIGGSIAASFTPPTNQSISGTVGASIIGTLPVVGSVSGYIQSSGGSVITIIQGSVATVGASTANQSVSGTVGIQYAPAASLVSGVTSVITGTSSVQVLAPAAGGQRNYITQVLVTNGAATGTFVNLYDATNVIYAGYAAASGGGFSVSFPAPLKQSSIAGNLSAAAITQASIIVSASGYTAP